MGLIGFTIRTTIVGGLVYYTYHEGLWSKSEDAAKLYTKICTNIAPYVKDNVPPNVVQESDSSGISCAIVQNEESNSSIELRQYLANLNLQLSHLPSVDDVSNLLKTSWNKGVMISTQFLADSPVHIVKGANNLSEVVQKYMKDINL